MGRVIQHERVNPELIIEWVHSATGREKRTLATRRVRKPVGKPIDVTEPMANVGLKMGETMNIGDFESVRVDVSLFYPSETQEVEKTFRKVKKIVERQLSETITEIEDEIGNKK